MSRNSMGRRRGLITAVALTLVSTIGLAATTGAATAALESRTESATAGSQMAKEPIFDHVAELEARKPQEVAIAAEALEPYVTITDDGMSLNAPDHVVAALDAEAVAAFRLSIKQINEMEKGAIDTPGKLPLSEILKFVKNNWRSIVDAAKKAGVWSLRKATRCLHGARDAIVKAAGNDPAYIAENPRIALAVAIAGCINRIR
ncbi:hypothetical protein GCM10011609_33150 [Lentzea pudingi]|uniref:Secreted protein n=1 Tax=Lentzea pudingi TaxID=1789439 RepID=A0ABQ2HVR6_9PSEU|nr:hypothetical protein [Lentzea pudingi]GGM93033.1 hypothetical protein GCM10011609_33150 [Lentzea pudingi]